jgi:hypothetical protein
MHLSVREVGDEGFAQFDGEALAAGGIEGHQPQAEELVVDALAFGWGRCLRAIVRTS